VALGVGLWLIFRDPSKKDDEEKPDLQPEPQPEDEMPTRPDPSETKWTDTVSWSGEYVAGENVVWTMQRGIRFQDGSTEMDSTIYIVIGNSNHTAFLRNSVSGGTINISKEESGGDEDMKNVRVFATLADAEAKADDLANPPEADPNDPTQPQRPPEEDDSGSGDGFSFPRQDGFNLGQNIGSYGGL
jgi:hypothetical protein